MEKFIMIHDIKFLPHFTCFLCSFPSACFVMVCRIPNSRGALLGVTKSGTFVSYWATDKHPCIPRMWIIFILKAFLKIK